MPDEVSIDRVKARVELLNLQEEDAQRELTSGKRPPRVHEELLRLLSRVRNERVTLLVAIAVAEQAGRTRLSWSELVADSCE